MASPTLDPGQRRHHRATVDGSALASRCHSRMRGCFPGEPHAAESRHSHAGAPSHGPASVTPYSGTTRHPRRA